MRMRKNEIAYFIYGPDNGGSFFSEAPPRLFCERCGVPLPESLQYAPRRLQVENVYPFSYTYDNRAICTRAFMEMCLRFDPVGVRFTPVSQDPELFWLMPIRILKLDYKRRQTKFDEWCEKCNRFAQVAGASPGFSARPVLDYPEGFYRTDVAFGSGREQAPAVIVGPRLKEHIDQQNYPGVYFKPIYYEN